MHTHYRSDEDAYLLEVARDNTQLLFNRLWDLPVEKVQNTITIELPDCKTRLPREKPVPKPKAESKWDKYASVKGIQKRKKSRMLFDEELQVYYWVCVGACVCARHIFVFIILIIYSPI